MFQRAVRIIELHEREDRLFPRADLFDQFGRSLILPETRELGAIDLRDLVNGIQLRALGLIGYLPLTGNIVLNIRPKFSTDNLWHMLNVSEETYKHVLPVLRSYQRINESAPHHLLVKGFCFYLRQILSLGVVRGYYQERYQGYFRPKVEFGKTIAQFLARGNDISTSSNVFTFSANLRVNGYLKSACLRFLRLIPKSEPWRAERMLLEAGLGVLEAVQPRQMAPDEGHVTDGVPMRVRDAYQGALTVYSVLLGHTKIGFSYDAEGSEMPSFLFRLDDVFENFVRNILRAGLRGNGISVADGNKPQNQRLLFRDNKRYPVKPDMIFCQGKTILAVGEVKYKPKIDEADRYQVISHTVALNAKIGIWISPAAADNETGLTYIGSLGTGFQFYHYRLNIGAALSNGCDRMVAEISRLVGVD